jgi:signal transduction histidine kinase
MPARIRRAYAEFTGNLHARLSHQPGRRPITDSAARRWDEEIRRAGLEAQPSKVMNLGVPLLAIVILAVALALSIFEADDGIRPFGLLLLLLAIAPWCFWLYAGDEGPHWKAIAGLLLPIALLNIGHWFVPAMGPGSENAYPALAFPPLLLTILAVSIAPTRIAIGIVIAAWAVMGLPMLAAHVAGKDITGTELVTWHVAVGLCIIAGYAVRFSNQANAAVTVAREVMVRQEATDERRQIARDVHDVVAHSLSVTMLHVTAARLALNRHDTDSARHALEEAERLGRASMTDIRRIVQVLRADGDSTIDLPQPTADQLDDLVGTWCAAGLEIDASIDPAIHSIDENAGMTLYRILQEAMTNAARHGNGHATVRAGLEGSDARLTVINPMHPARRTGSPGSGMIGMKERAETAGGSLTARRNRDQWIVEARIPGAATPSEETRDPRPACR